jgi:hypothetical protein
MIAEQLQQDLQASTSAHPCKKADPMRRIPFLSSAVAAGLLLAVGSSPAAGQTGAHPPISTRQFKGGSVTVTVTGSAKIDQEVPINTKASFGDGEMTWLQFGVSGSEEPNVLITYGQSGETGVGVGRGKFIAIGEIMPGEKSQCSGDVKVTGVSVSGQYTCTGVVSHEPGAGMGKVDIKVRFTADS